MRRNWDQGHDFSVGVMLVEEEAERRRNDKLPTSWVLGFTYTAPGCSGLLAINRLAGFTYIMQTCISPTYCKFRMYAMPV